MTDTAARDALAALVIYLHDLPGCPALSGGTCDCGRNEAVLALRGYVLHPVTCPGSLDAETLSAAWEAVHWLESGKTDQADGDAATASKLRAALAKPAPTVTDLPDLLELTEPTTKAGTWLVERSRWDVGMRGFFVRINATAGPEDMHRHVLAIEAEAVAAERARLRKAVRAIDGIPLYSGDDDEMCPNCVAPWKCNGPHVPPNKDPVDVEISRSAVLALLEVPNE